ncbi:MAG: site-specific integrase [Dysgonamonadaceae bacterium]|nr:site-specific integrase [Dysgonamonadaceae bacterium]MDD4729119.1 site-specific integrase [Dysgonamonadaceae bacterium]
MRVTLSGERPLDFPIGHTIDLAHWDMGMERALDGAINKSNQTATDINRTIDEYRYVINEIFARYELIEKRKPTLGEIKDLFNDMVGRKTAITQDLSDQNADLFKVFDLFTRTVGEQNQWAKSTYQKFKAIKQHLHSFDKYLNFHTIDESKMQKYVQWLHKKDMRNTTIAKNIDYVRWFLRWSARKGYYTGNLHETFKPKFKGIDGNSKEIIYLNQDELKLLQNFSGKEYLERVRDVFLFCCFTGLRYSDVAQLTKSDISQGAIKFVTQKTSESLTIELNKHSKYILDKYENVSFPNDKALPVISNVKMNLYLKELGKQCELNTPQKIVYFQGNSRKESIQPKWSLLTTHCARRTFVVNALYLGIPSEVIMRWTGHADFKAMKPYIKIVDELKEREMSKFDQF